MAVTITGTDTNVVGLDFYAVVGDGGPQLVDWGLPAGTPAPGFVNLPANVNITGAGTIFAGNNGGAFDLFAPNGPPGSLPQAAAYETTTLSPTNPVTDNGTLAFLTFSTVGFSSGSWPLALDDTALGGTDHTDLVLQGNGLIVPTVIGGEIKIVPEPASVVLAVVGIIALLGSTGRVRRRHVA